MTKRHDCRVLLLVSLVLTLLFVPSRGFSAEAVTLNALSGDLPAEAYKEGAWLVERSEPGGIQVRTLELTLHPQPEPQPALKYRLVPDDFDMIEGNAAIFYLKAIGFLEQDDARAALRDFAVAARERARREGKPEDELGPFAWDTMTPEELPLKEVKDYLILTSHQPYFVQEASRRRSFNLERNLRDVDNPIAYPLPEVQSLRQLARMQSLRCKVALAEERLDDALAILGQQYAMARHLAQDEIVITQLIAIAIAGIAWNDALQFVQQPGAPNLYWAFAALPRPPVDVRHAMALERQLVLLQLTAIREVDETPRPAEYWQEFLDRFYAQFRVLSQLTGTISSPRDDPEVARAAIVAYIAAAYPAAKRYLIEDLGLPREKVEAYPTAQVVFLAMIRYHERARDDLFKWTYLPFWQQWANQESRESNRASRALAERLGWAGILSESLIGSPRNVLVAAARAEQQVALIQ
ncbi:MAG: hypothetical protein ACOY3P_08360, partial [Planctomycetota bacterium]